MSQGDRLLALFFGAIGALLVWQGRDLTYWDRFAPGSGFLPVWLGAALVALVALLLLRNRAEPNAASERGAWRKPAVILVGLTLCVALVEWLGFVVAVGAYLMFLLLFVERLPARLGGGVAVGATLSIYLIFAVWLRVPLPKGPWGF
jgi:hypothetical protein